MKKNSTFFTRAFLIFVVLSGIFFFNFKTWEKKPVIDWDITQYYSYLPATFIYHDYRFDDPDILWREAHFKFTVVDGDTLPMKMTMGLAYLYSPFFLGAHVYALATDHAANAFSTPYRIGILLSLLFAAFAGFWFLGKFLMHFFDGKIAAITAFLIFVGTNITYYSFAEPMSHVYSFALVSFLLHYFIKYFKSPSLRRAALIGLALGILVLIRPTNVLVLVFPLTLLLTGYFKLQGVMTRHLPIALLLAVLAIFPQLLYWKHMTGEWLFYSYGDERFFFADPEIWKGLFSYRKGWLVYSPLLFFAFAGFYFLFKQHKAIAWASCTTLFCAIWVVFSWWCWWYGGGFGARALIEYLPFMALPLAALVNWLRQKRLWLQMPVFLIMAYFCFTSLFMSMQYFNGMIHHDAMSKELFWKQYMKGYYVKGYHQLMNPPDYEAALRNEY